MTPALVLVDMQHDFLNTENLQPAAGDLIDRASGLLKFCRASSIPVIHVRTGIDREADNRMPHWKRDNYWACVKGSRGYGSPNTLRPVPGETIVHKSFYSGFETRELEYALRSLKIDTLLVAGVHVHGCIRATVLDGYQRGFDVWVIEDVVGSCDRLHAAATFRYLETRAARFVSTASLIKEVDSAESDVPWDRIDAPDIAPLVDSKASSTSAAPAYFEHMSPRSADQHLWRVPIGDRQAVSDAVEAGKTSWKAWRRTGFHDRRRVLLSFAELLASRRDRLIRKMAIEVGKPVGSGDNEFTRGLALIRAAIDHCVDAQELDSKSHYRFVPLGLIGMVTPWNNPLAIPIGKLAPALLYGNAVLWKPALQASSIASELTEILERAGCPKGVVSLVCGDASTAKLVMSNPDVDAVTLSGPSAAGYFAQEICATRRIPLQAELGGNNAAIVWSDCDFEKASRLVVEGAFGFSGQHCTANRRVIVDASCYDEFCALIESAVDSLVWGDPLLKETQVGPVISAEKRQDLANLIARSAKQVERFYVRQKMTTGFDTSIASRSTYYPPTVVYTENADVEIVQAETFGPVMVVLKASGWDHAMELCNGVRQGLVAAVFSSSTDRQQRFVEDAQAGILKINRATTGVGVELPFFGWKESGIGPPEHGFSNREFYTKIQTIYR